MRAKILLLAAVLLLSSFSGACSFVKSPGSEATQGETEMTAPGSEATQGETEMTAPATETAATQAETAKRTPPLKVVCAGDSITYGTGAAKATTDSYPAVLQGLLGGDYTVVNCGKAKATCLPDASAYFNTNGIAYLDTAEYLKSIKSSPDIVLIMLGTNDAKNIPPSNQAAKDEFYEALCSLAKQYMALPSQPEVYILTSPYRTEDYAKQVYTQESIVPLQKQAAEDLGLAIIDLNLSTQGFASSLYYDKLHFTTAGYKELAGIIAEAMIKTN